MLEELCKRIQHCCATPRRSRNKRNVGSCSLKSLTRFKLRATACKRSVQTDATCNTQQCCVRLHWAMRSLLFIVEEFVRVVNMLFIIVTSAKVESCKLGTSLRFGQAKRASRERAPRGFAARSRVLVRLVSLAQIGELARRLIGHRKSRLVCSEPFPVVN